MARVGTLGQYNPETEEWTQYVERMEFYFIANDIGSEDKKRATFVGCVGPGTYTFLRSLIAPAKTTDKTLAQLTEILGNHYCPKPSAIVQRSKFYNRI